MKKLKIVFFYNKRLSFYPPDYLGSGLGASESALVVLSESLVTLGHNVEVYNCCYKEGAYNGVQWRRVDRIRFSTGIDAFIAIRSVDVFKNNIKAPVRGIWVVDSDVPGVEQFLKARTINLAMTVSDFQEKKLFKKYPGLRKIAFQNGLPFDDILYSPYQPTQKVKGKCIYCSVPHRGLEKLTELWPAIKRLAPWAKLYITSDLGLWGLTREENDIMFGWLYAKISKLKDVVLLKKISKEELAKHQAESEVILYPNTVDELFCMSIAECCGVGTVPITSARGALPERVRDGKTGFLIYEKPNTISYNKKFVKKVSLLLHKHKLRECMGEECRRDIIKFKRETFALRVEHKLISMLETKSKYARQI